MIIKSNTDGILGYSVNNDDNTIYAHTSIGEVLDLNYGGAPIENKLELKEFVHELCEVGAYTTSIKRKLMKEVSED